LDGESLSVAFATSKFRIEILNSPGEEEQLIHNFHSVDYDDKVAENEISSFFFLQKYLYVVQAQLKVVNVYSMTNFELITSITQ
jgi:hypothetical protein